MKRIVFVFLSIITLASYAQQPIAIITVNETMSKGNQPGYATDIPQASLDEVKSAWMKRIQENTKTKAIDQGHEIVINGAIEKEISPDPINIYSLLLNKDSLVHLVVFFETDSAKFFDPEADKGDLVASKIDLGIRNFMQEFAVDQYENAVEDELDLEEDKLKELNKELKSLKDDQEKYEKNIKSSEQKIASAEEEVAMLNTQTATALEQIEAARLNVSTITDKEAKKSATKDLNSIEKEKKKLDNEKEKHQKNIVGHQTDIKEYNKEIERLTEAQEEVEALIEKQEEQIEAVEKKLKGMK